MSMDTNLAFPNGLILQDREIFDSISELIVVQDMEHRILFANQAAGVTVGQEPWKLLGRHCYEVWHKRSDPCRGCPLERTLQSGRSEEGLIESFDGRVWNIRSYPVFNEQGEMAGATEITLDITDWKRAEEECQTSRARLEALLNAITQPVCLIDAQGKIVASNVQTALHLRRSSQRDILGRCIFDLLPRDSGQRLAEWLQRTITGKSSCRTEERIDGSIYDIHSYPVLDEHSEVIQVAVFAADVTDQRQAEERLRDKAAEQSLLLDTIDTQIWYVIDPARYGKVNQARAAFLGLRQEEVENKGLAEIMAPEEAKVCIEGNREVFRQKRQMAAEEWCKSAAGEMRLLHITKTPKLNAAGEVEYIVCTAIDMTEHKRTEQALKRSEARLKRSQEVARVATWERDLQRNELFWSDEQFRMYGYEPSNGLDKREIIKKHIHPEDLERVHRVGQEALRGLRPYDIRFRFTTAQGQERIGHCIGEVEWDEQGRPLRIFGTMQDVTERVRIEEALQKSREHYQHLLQSSRRTQSFHSMIGRSKQMQQIYVLLQQLANVNTSVLVTGESGTGKELIVDTLHAISQRSQGPLIKVNCLALAEELLESELFGHVRGAFTGAYYNKTGRIEAAEGGTLLLDEIGDITPRIQLKLLRFLEEKRYERVGDSKTHQADVRIVAATNADLSKKVQEGSFRQDLYYRLKVMPVHLPPLRERSEDIPLLINHFCKQFGATFDKEIRGVSPEAMRVLLDYPWPGNVRELEHALEHGALLCPGGDIELQHLPGELLAWQAGEQALEFPGRAGLDRQAIAQALHAAKGNKCEAARQLGISRRTLYRKLHAFGLMEELS
jgi:PAS domain S-box-containing protein